MKKACLILIITAFMMTACSDSTIIIGDSAKETIITAKGISSHNASEWSITTETINITKKGEYFLQHAVNFNGSSGVVYEFSPLINGTPVSHCGTREQSSTDKPYSNSAGCLVNLTTGDIISYGVKTNTINLYLNNAYLLIKKTS